MCTLLVTNNSLDRYEQCITYGSLLLTTDDCYNRLTMHVTLLSSNFLELDNKLWVTQNIRATLLYSIIHYVYCLRDQMKESDISMEEAAQETDCQLPRSLVLSQDQPSYQTHQPRLPTVLWTLKRKQTLNQHFRIQILRFCAYSMS